MKIKRLVDRLFRIPSMGERKKTHNLGHVENDDGRLETHTNTSNETTSNDSTEGITKTSDHLDHATDHVDEAAENDSPLAADHVGKVTGDEGAKEGTAGQNGDDERLVRFRDGSGAGASAFDGIDEHLRAENTVDVTGVITEEDTTERGEGADQVGLPCDGGFDAFDILGVSEPGDVG